MIQETNVSKRPFITRPWKSQTHCHFCSVLSAWIQRRREPHRVWLAGGAVWAFWRSVTMVCPLEHKGPCLFHMKSTLTSFKGPLKLLSIRGSAQNPATHHESSSYQQEAPREVWEQRKVFKYSFSPEDLRTSFVPPTHLASPGQIGIEWLLQTVWFKSGQKGEIRAHGSNWSKVLVDSSQVHVGNSWIRVHC